MPIRVLYAGDGESSGYLKSALERDSEIDVTHMKQGEAPESFPRDMERLGAFDAVILSDIGADSILLYANRYTAPMGPNRLKLIRRYVAEGGGLMMIGGWSSFGGKGGQARWTETPVEDALPVIIRDGDDRMETPEGCTMERWDIEHPIIRGLPVDEPFILSGYNRFKAKPDSRVLARIENDPAIVVGDYGKGRSIAFATDCAPHWAGTFINWPGYNELWIHCVKWLSGKL